MTGLQILADSSHVPFQSSPGKAALALLTLPLMTHVVSSPLSVSILTFRERKYCSPSQPMTGLSSTTYPWAVETSWVPGGETDKGRQMTSEDLGGRVSQEQGESGLLGQSQGCPGRGISSGMSLTICPGLWQACQLIKARD